MNGFRYETALTWIPLLPILSAIVLGFAGRRADKGLVAGLGIGSVALSFVLAVLCALRAWGVVGPSPALLHADLGTWFSLQGAQSPIAIDVRFVMDGLAATMATMVTGVGLLIHVYSGSYMHDDEGFARFFAYLNLFTGAMLVLVLASSLPVLFVGWEGVGVCSYLLIGFWFKTPAYAAAAKKAFLVNRIGDLGVLLGMLLLATETGAVEIDAINRHVPTLVGTVSPLLPLSIVTAASLLLFLGCAGKSAQLPLYVWLPDAMAGPTPVSALIHAATMVTAGVYLCCRMSPLFLASTEAMAIITVVGAATAAIGGVVAVAQKDLKKILAYSTVSQLGFMFGAIGVGAFSAAIFHVFTHAFFKACLFLGAGSVMHAVGAHGDADVTKLGGLRKELPVTFATFTVATLAIAGFPLTAGFFSKDAILAGAAGIALHAPEGTPKHLVIAAWITLVVLVLVALLTAFYMTRCTALIFTGSYRGEGAGYDAEPHESPRAMTVPLVVLSLGAISAGWLSFGEPSLWSRMLGSAVRDLELTPAAHGSAHGLALGLGTTVALVGLAAGGLLFVNKDVDVISTRLPDGLYRFLLDALRVDAFYDRVVLAPIRGLATFVAAIDRTFLEFLTLGVPALKAEYGSRALLQLQNGYVQSYGLAMAVGLVGVLGFLEWPRADVDVVTSRDGAAFHVAGGLGQRVRVDLDSDGTYDSSWTTDTDFEATYTAGDYRGVAILATLPPNGVKRLIRLTREGELLGSSTFGSLWRGEAREGEGAALPVFVRADGYRAVIRANGEAFNARIRADRMGDEVRLEPGQSFELGRVRAQVVGVVRATIEIENVFGSRRRVRMDVALTPEPRGARRAEPAAPAAHEEAAP